MKVRINQKVSQRRASIPANAGMIAGSAFAGLGQNLDELSNGIRQRAVVLNPLQTRMSEGGEGSVALRALFNLGCGFPPTLNQSFTQHIGARLDQYRQ
jgi:hypothetical protein